MATETTEYMLKQLFVPHSSHLNLSLAFSTAKSYRLQCECFRFNVVCQQLVDVVHPQAKKKQRVAEKLEQIPADIRRQASPRVPRQSVAGLTFEDRNVYTHSRTYGQFRVTSDPKHTKVAL